MSAFRNPGTIVVTGGAGFIGSNLVRRLGSSVDEAIVVCDTLGDASEAKWRNLIGARVDDFLLPDQLRGYLAAEPGVSTIVHLGAVSSTTEPDSDLVLATNFALTRDLYEHAASRNCDFLWASSAAVYGDGDLGFEDSCDPKDLRALRPLNVYGYSKLLADQYVARRAREGAGPRRWFGLRFFNVFGPGEQHKGPMASMVSQLWAWHREGVAVQLFASHKPEHLDGGQLRDFVYVDDVTRVIEFLLYSGSSGIYNVGTGVARSFNDVVAALEQAGSTTIPVAYAPMPERIRSAYQYRTCASLERLRSSGYTAQFRSLEEGVASYLDSTPRPGAER